MPQLDPLWKKIAEDAPDSRVSGTNLTWSRKEQKDKFLGNMEMCYCANCGREKGMITKNWAAYVFALCDDCVAKHGPPPGMQQLPDEWVEGGK
jgi:hypothetical protein